MERLKGGFTPLVGVFCWQTWLSKEQGLENVTISKCAGVSQMIDVPVASAKDRKRVCKELVDCMVESRYLRLSGEKR